MSDMPWYQEFAGADYLRIYSPFLPLERSAREVANIVKLLNLAPNNSILDLCCGHGRHTIPLAQQGYRMTGLDLSQFFLERAQIEAETKGVKVQWIQSDMRHIPFENEFDAIVNIFTSFGYLENEEEDLQVLRQVQQALKPGGLFLLETIYQVRVIRTFSPHGIIRYHDGLIVLEERRLNLPESRNEITITMIYPDGQRKKYRQSIRIYTLTELRRMLKSVGIEVQAYYGDLDGGALTVDSRMVVVGKKME
ncbi:MAG: methyltransferase domain-containing protein [Ktedonobacteraceae bacterium]|nr:methyltransferase domain-containing protein [Ktedonobacteraceae bacterium]